MCLINYKMNQNPNGVITSGLTNLKTFFRDIWTMRTAAKNIHDCAERGCSISSKQNGVSVISQDGGKTWTPTKDYKWPVTNLEEGVSK